MRDPWRGAQAGEVDGVARRLRGSARMTAPTPARPLPAPTPETQHFWDGTAQRELRLQRCGACATTYFPPQPFCPACSSDDVAVVRASGRGSLYSYVITHLPAPGFEAPYVLAVVALDEGPRLLTNLVGVEPDPDSLPLDLAVEVMYEPVGEITLPLFRPADP
jgi:uncharacterized OB-fold protein